MSLSPQAQLFAIALALYLQDTILLLNANEGVLSRSFSGVWRLKFGSEQTHIGSKEFFSPHLFLIHRPIYRLSWNYERGASDHQAVWNPRTQVLQPIGYVAMLIGVIEFGLFPLVIAFHLTDMSLALCLSSLYLAIAAGLTLVGKRQKELDLSRCRFISLCFECLICPPVALNLVRKLSLNLCKDCDMVQVAQATLLPPERDAAREDILARLDTQIYLEEEGTLRHAALQLRRNDLTSWERV